MPTTYARQGATYTLTNLTFANGIYWVRVYNSKGIVNIPLLKPGYTYEYNGYLYSYDPATYPRIALYKGGTTYYLANKKVAKVAIPAGTYTPQVFKQMIEPFLPATLKTSGYITVNNQSIVVYPDGSQIRKFGPLSSPGIGSTITVIDFASGSTVTGVNINIINAATGFTIFKQYVVDGVLTGAGEKQYFNNYMNVPITIGGSGLVFN